MGEEIQYKITEEYVYCYTGEVNGYNITNVYKPPTPPATGDNFNVSIYWAMMILSLIGIIVIKRKESQV